MASDECMVLTKAEVALLLRVSERTVERMAKKGDLPMVQGLGRVARFPAAAIRRIADEGRLAS